MFTDCDFTWDVSTNTEYEDRSPIEHMDYIISHSECALECSQQISECVSFVYGKHIYLILACRRRLIVAYPTGQSEDHYCIYCM